MCSCMSKCAHVHSLTHACRAPGTTGVSSLLPSRGSQGSTSGYPTWSVTCRRPSQQPAAVMVCHSALREGSFYSRVSVPEWNGETEGAGLILLALGLTISWFAFTSRSTLTSLVFICRHVSVSVHASLPVPSLETPQKGPAIVLVMHAAASSVVSADRGSLVSTGSHEEAFQLKLRACVRQML